MLKNVNVKTTTSSRRKLTGTPYDPKDAQAVADFWKGAVRHTGLTEFQRKRGQREGRSGVSGIAQVKK